MMLLGIVNVLLLLLRRIVLMRGVLIHNRLRRAASGEQRWGCQMATREGGEGSGGRNRRRWRRAQRRSCSSVAAAAMAEY